MRERMGTRETRRWCSWVPYTDLEIITPDLDRKVIMRSHHGRSNVHDLDVHSVQNTTHNEIILFPDKDVRWFLVEKCNVKAYILAESLNSESSMSTFSWEFVVDSELNSAPIEEALAKTKLYPIEHYIAVRRNTVVQQIATRSILLPCRDAQKQKGSMHRMMWCQQLPDNL